MVTSLAKGDNCAAHDTNELTGQIAMRHIHAIAAILAMLSLPAVAADPSVPTRFGPISIAGGNALTFRGKPLSPAVTGNSGLQVFPADVHPIGDVDAVVVTDVGGAMCPAQFLVFAVSKMGVTVSKRFGNCSEALDAKVVGGKLVMTQPGKTGGTDRWIWDAATGMVVK